MSEVDCQPSRKRYGGKPENNSAMWTIKRPSTKFSLNAPEKDNDMSRSASHYPISQLISRIIEDSGLRRSEFISSLDYRSIEGGLRRLDEWLDLGEGDSRILDKLVAAYHVDPGDLEKALAATKEMRDSEAKAAAIERLRFERDRFQQFIHVEGEHRIPSGITVFGMSGGHRRWTTIVLPKELQGRPVSEQIPGLIGLMNEYLITYKGFCPFFGKATGFRLVRFDDSIRFNIVGEFVEQVLGQFGPRVEVTIGNKVIVG
jgi:hypothetical protein